MSLAPLQMVHDTRIRGAFCSTTAPAEPFKAVPSYLPTGAPAGQFCVPQVRALWRSASGTHR